MSIVAAARAEVLKKLIAIGEQGDAPALRTLLAGGGLPALANDVTPAEWIQDALESSATYYAHARPIAALLAPLVKELATRQSDARRWASYAANLCQLAAWLPLDDALFAALLAYEQAQPTHLPETDYPLFFQLRRALAEQQPDTRLSGRWLGVLQDHAAAWTPARRTDLMESFRALICPLDFDADLKGALDSISTGLCALHDAVAVQPESAALLQLAFRKLDTAHPLDPNTWAAYLAPYLNAWPSALLGAAIQYWPPLADACGNPLATLPADLAALVSAMTPAQQERLRDLVNRDAEAEGRAFLIKELLFAPPKVPDLAPQAVRTALARLADHLWPAERKSAPTQPQLEDEEADDTPQPHARPAKTRPPVHRQKLLENINRTLGEIEKRLESGDEATARRYLEELLTQQRDSRLADQYIHTAKTLAKAAAIAQRFDRLEWAETLLRDACRENHDDVVSACGLADVLKARGDLDGAETQYRQNVARWPNNEVSACGLAEVLKARGDLDGAEAQYRQNVARWPNDEVSANGLADVLKALGDLDGAETQYRQNVARWPNNEVSACGLADVLKARGDLDGAETQYRQNVARWPNNEVSACGLADVLKARGDLDGAETQYRQNVARWPNDVVSACGLADVLKARGNLDGAEAQYRQNVARWPNDRVAVHGLANVLRKKKRHDEALALLPAPKTTTLLAQDAYDLHLRAMILWEQRKLLEAREALELGVRFAVGTYVRQFQSSLALLDLRSGDLTKAEARLAELPDNVVYLDLVRLDVAAAQAQRKAAELSDALITRLTHMNSGERLVFDLLRKDYAITAVGVGRQPTEAERDELFDAEIDMLLAA